jgi:hypothetical protein
MRKKQRGRNSHDVVVVDNAMQCNQQTIEIEEQFHSYLAIHFRASRSHFPYQSPSFPLSSTLLVCFSSRTSAWPTDTSFFETLDNNTIRRFIRIN